MRSRSRLVIRFRFAAACLALAAGAALAAIWFWPESAAEGFVVEQLARELENLPEDAAVARLGQVAQLRNRSLPLLVSALSDRRPRVAAAAADLIHARMDRLAMLPADEAAALGDRLTALLAGQIDQMEAPQRAAAADWATGVLMAMTDRPNWQNTNTIGNCERILRASLNSPRSFHVSPDEEGLSSSSAGATGGDKPLEEAKPQGGEATPAMPSLLAEVPSLERRLPPSDDSSGDRRDDSAERSSKRTWIEAKSPADDANGGKEALANTGALTPAALRAHSDLEVMQMLHAASRYTQDAARQELRRRGCSELHLELAARLTHPDAEIRRQLAEQLPDIAGIDAHRWLARLSRDEAPEVRGAAAAILATSAAEAGFQADSDSSNAAMRRTRR